MNAQDALNRLKDGNITYLSCTTSCGNVSQKIREETSLHGQHPYAVIIACSDSREIPEAIFSAGIGELFTIRVAGNVVHETELGSIEYAVHHLGVKLVAVVGHTNCGAVGAALKGETNGYVGTITKDIIRAVRGIADPASASRRNIVYQKERILEKLTDLPDDVKVIGALYHIDCGVVEWMED